MFRNVKLLAASAALALSGLSANAALLNAPVPGNTYISLGGLDWAWANPLPASSPSFDLSYQSQFGWRLPTAAELMSAPLATQFQFAGANVPLGGVDPISGANFQAPTASLIGAAACAAPYFSNNYRHCDWQDGLGEPLGPWAGMPGAASFAEQLVVRAVPLPAAVLLLAGALGAMAGLRRRV